MPSLVFSYSTFSHIAREFMGNCSLYYLALFWRYDLTPKQNAKNRLEKESACAYVCVCVCARVYMYVYICI